MGKLLLHQHKKINKSIPKLTSTISIRAILPIDILPRAILSPILRLRRITRPLSILIAIGTARRPAAPLGPLAIHWGTFRDARLLGNVLPRASGIGSYSGRWSWGLALAGACAEAATTFGVAAGPGRPFCPFAGD